MVRVELMMGTLEKEIAAIIADVGEIDESIIGPNKTLREVGIDSLMGLVIAVEVEKKYEVYFSDSEMKGLRTFDDIVKLTRSKLQISQKL